MNYQKIQELSFSNFGPFVGSHTIKLPDSGLVLLKGNISETGGGSGAGKTYFLNTIPYVLSKCPFPATELQSWYTEEAPEAIIKLNTSEGLFKIARKKGLSVEGGSLTKVLKGKAAEPELDRIFGNLDSEIRGKITYRGQRKPGLFLGMDDSEKKSFLTRVLELDKFEKVSKSAELAIKGLEEDYNKAVAALELTQGLYDAAKEVLDGTKFDGSLSELYSAQINMLEMDIQKLKEEIDKENNLFKTQNENYKKIVDMVSQTTRERVLEITNSKLPPEIDVLKTELEKQKTRLDKCKQYDQEQKLKFVNQKNELVNQLTNTLNNLSKEIIEVNNQADRACGKLQMAFMADDAQTLDLSGKKASLLEQIKDAEEFKKELETLKEKEAKLLQNICPTCSQQWDKAKLELEANRIRQAQIVAGVECLTSLKEQLGKIEGNITEYAKERKVKLDADIKAIRSSQQVKIDEINDEKAFIEASKAEEIKALVEPEEHPAGAQVKAKINELNKQIAQITEDFTKNKQKLVQELLDAEKESLAGHKEVIEKIHSTCKANIEALTLQKENKSIEISNLKNKINELQLQQAVLAERTRAFIKIQEDLELARAKKSDVEFKLNLESDIVALVGYKGFLGAIFSDILDEIATQTNDILGHVANVRHLTLGFDTEKEAASTGNVTSRITPVIYSRGRQVGFNAGISGGMQAAVELAVDLAVSNVVSSRRGSYPNFMILDESLHGLSGVEKENCIEMLQNFVGERLVLIVDHSSEFCNLFTQVIEIAQEDGISRIVT